MTILDVGVGTFTVSFFAGLFVLAFILGRVARTNAPPLLALLLLGVVVLILATLQPTAPSSTVVVTTVVRRGRRARRRARARATKLTAHTTRTLVRTAGLLELLVHPARLLHRRRLLRAHGLQKRAHHGARIAADGEADSWVKAGADLNSSRSHLFFTARAADLARCFTERLGTVARGASSRARYVSRQHRRLRRARCVSRQHRRLRCARCISRFFWRRCLPRPATGAGYGAFAAAMRRTCCVHALPPASPSAFTAC